MNFKTVKAFLLIVLFACNNNRAVSFVKNTTVSTADTTVHFYKDIAAIPLPQGYARIAFSENSFASWLRTLQLKEDNTVYLYNGQQKLNQSAQFAVVDISVGDKDLQQCADAVMRLRAEYLFDRHEFEKIVFTDNAGTDYKFRAPYNQHNLAMYLEKVFGMCGSASLARQLKQTLMAAIKPGDVLIRGGFPGHAVMVMDVAENSEGKKIYLLAQSYMPAQDIHVLNNPASSNQLPWYEVNEDKLIATPEYTFKNTELKTW